MVDVLFNYHAPSADQDLLIPGDRRSTTIIVYPGQKGYLLPGVPGFCQNVPGTGGDAAGAAAAAAAGPAAAAAAASAVILATTCVVVKIRAVAAAAAPAAAPAAAAAATPAGAPAVPGTFWQNPGTPGPRYPLSPG